MKFLLAIFAFLILHSAFLIPAQAIVDPLSVPNNKFGIHIISGTPDESSPSSSLVNSTGGDWGYITFLIESKDRNEGKWQEFFNDLRRRHLIPIVRLATKPNEGNWEKPYEGEETAWADFLDKLNWPIKNRYVVIYNEPNHGTEWNGTVDPKTYAQVLDKTITALKNKSKDFFVINAGLDASAPQLLPKYMDEAVFLRQMEEAVPGIFNKLDGWSSHSYPNPAFAGSPNGVGKGSVRTYIWETQLLRSLGLTKNLPIFITETGWKHAEGLSYDPSLPSAENVAQFYQQAFRGAWNSSNIVAITPFLLSYQESLFDHFSFKNLDKNGGWYPQFQALMDLPKNKGLPIQENKAQLVSGEVYSSLVAGQNYSINLSFKNIGQSIWNPSTSLRAIVGGSELGIQETRIPEGISIEPGGEYTLNIALKAPEKGSFDIKLALFQAGRQFDTDPISFKTEVKLPVILKVLSTLRLKDNPSGEYILKVSGVVGDLSQKVTLGANGQSKDIEARYLLPDYSFEFSLEKPFYSSKTITQKVSPGVNTLDFGTLNPDILSIILHPVTYLKQK